MKWGKIGKLTGIYGSSIFYGSSDTSLQIESRKRHIPHANGREGTWDYTSFFVLDKHGRELAEKHTLKDAKEFAENYKEDAQ